MATRTQIHFGSNVNGALIVSMHRESVLNLSDNDVTSPRGFTTCAAPYGASSHSQSLPRAYAPGLGCIAPLALGYLSRRHRASSKRRQKYSDLNAMAHSPISSIRILPPSFAATPRLCLACAIRNHPNTYFGSYGIPCFFNMVINSRSNVNLRWRASWLSMY